jgi:cysteine desulfurase
VVSSAIEHAAVLEALKDRDYILVAPREDGAILPEAVKAAIRPDTELVTIAYANNEIGTIQSLSDIAAVVKDERRRRNDAGEAQPIYFHSDASQGAGILDLHVSRLGLDALTLNAGKVYGPKQVGLLWASSTVKLRAYTMGGGQERGLRSGTENVAGTVGFAKALQVTHDHRAAEAARLRKLRDALQTRLVESFPDAVISGSHKKQLPGFLHISFPGLDAERLLMMCESRGVLVATGSACAANKGTRSHVLTAIGLAPEVADGSLRITLGKLSTEDNVVRAGDIIIDVVSTERARVVR